MDRTTIWKSGWPGQDGERTMLADFGEATAFEALLSERGAEIAAVFLEPVLGSAGVVEPPAGFLERVAEATRRAGAMFVVDEVITLRLAEGGGQQIFEVKPDLTMFGKIIGGGFPVGAIGGSEDVMSAFDPRNRGSIFHSGTFNGNPVTCAAGTVSIRELTQARIDKMAKQGERLAAELARAARQVELPFSVRHCGSLMNVFFLKEPPPPTIAREDARAIANFHLAALNQGLFLAPRGMIALSTVITDEVAERDLRARRKSDGRRRAGRRVAAASAHSISRATGTRVIIRRGFLFIASVYRPRRETDSRPSHEICRGEKFHSSRRHLPRLVCASRIELVRTQPHSREEYSTCEEPSYSRAPSVRSRSHRSARGRRWRSRSVTPRARRLRSSTSS